MQREMNWNEVSDGKLYTQNDLVKADCGDCKGCSACCRGMGASIVLDPLDIFQLCTQLGRSFENLLEKEIELNLVDGVILPNLNMQGAEEKCAFLNAQGRCEIHSFRPGFCRMFPLGRVYEDGGFHYFLQVHECKNQNRAKVKVKKWLGVPDIKRYEQFVSDWHYLIKEVGALLQKTPEEALRKTITMYVLRQFYLKPWEQETDFYTQFEERFKQAKTYLYER